ncbi:uncharacterized protein LOC115444520 [Manduca sexta]|uniref:Uncharacterized protein n=1 Tax=Manduca sexta TaxID=7130 RepID=A0A921Z553_MANSE|nr:uncharacterized protein LOC115444520 [Manduca sexta]KAG6451588.1 hypothetical protein O3G_MSEX007215 [Manduca sexta]
MDGDGQSMLAIVQSLRDAGLVVTVVDGKHGGNSATAVLAINAINPQHLERRSLGINTRFKSIQHSSTQANDLRYATVYQLAHCGRKSASPSVHLPEFPPQRAAPHLTEGNFVVPGWRGSECQYTPVRSTRSCRGNLHWTDRVGSVYRSEDTSAFAHSLRKYPSLSPNRSLSTELVQRLLTYTQNKSFSKSSYHTRNVRESSPAATKPEKTDKCSKNVQTCTRTKPERTDKTINTPYEIKYQGKPREKSRHSLRDKHPSTAYDYLRRTKPRGWNTRGTEVRYLTDVTKYIKDAIRNICDEVPMMCPSVQTRYSHHRRMHHLQTNGQSTSTNKADTEAAADVKDPCGTLRCGPPNNICPKIQTRYNQHKKHQHSGLKSCSDFNNIEIQACPPPVVREASVMTKSKSSTALPSTCPASVKTCCFCKRPLPCICKSETGRRIQKEVLDWIKEIPVYSDDTKDNKYLRCMLSKKLIENLQKMIKDGDFGKIREEIDKCLNVLPMWCPENDKDKTIFKNQIAGNLITRLKQFMEKDLFKEKIISWFNELPFKDQIKPEDREKIIDNLVKRLKAVERVSNDNAYKEALKNEIIKVLSDIPGINKDVITLMANKLADDLVPLDTKENAQYNEIRNKICEWIDTTSEFTENNFYVKDNIQVIDDLSKTLTDLQQNVTDGEHVKELMKKDTENWLQTVYKNKNILLDINTKNKLAQKLIDKLYPTKPKSPSDQYVQSIFDWLKDTPELSKFLNEDLLVAKLAEELQELKMKGYDDDALLEVIEDWINALCKKHGIDIDPKVVRELAEKLMDKLKLRKRKPRKLAKNFQETISEEVSRILETDSIPLNSKVKKNLQHKITNILSNNIENVLSNETSNAKKDLVKLLQHEGNMTPEEAKNLADTVINSTKTMPITEEQKKSATKSITREVKEERDETRKSATEYEEDSVASISDLLPDEMIRGTKAQTIKDNGYILDETTIPDEQTGDVSPKFTKRTREMSLEPTRQDFTRSTISPRHALALAPKQKENLRQNVERTVFDYIDDILVEFSPSTRENIRTNAKAFIDNVSQLLQNNNDKESVLKEVQNFLNSTPVPSNTTQKELADKLTTRLLGSGFQTSTPRRDFYFQPRRLTFDTSLPSIHFDDNSLLTQQRMPEEDKYREDLTKVVKSWLDKMPLSLNEDESKRFKEIVINDLVGDIIDRQKYLQLNASVKPSEIEELENLKYQVFRWLNKIMDARDFDIVLPQTEALMNSVRGVAVPQLAKPSGIRQHVKKSEGQIPNYLDALQDEISVWVDNIPKYLHQSTDKKYQNQMISELAKNLQHVEGENVDYVIKEWLQIFFRYSSQDDINKVAQDLKKKITSKGFSKNLSWMLEQDSNEFIEENLHGGIMDWLKVFPYYQSANAQDRNTQEKLVVSMAKGLTNVFETALTTSLNINTNELFINEIVKYLQKFPMDAKKKSDPNFVRNTAKLLLQHLKELQMFQSISARHATIRNDLDNSIDEWINSLPIVDKQNRDSRQFEALTKQFKQNLNNLRGDEKGLREEIKKQLKILPIDPVKLNEENFLNKKVEQLLRNIQASEVEEVPDSLYEDILLDIDSSFGPIHTEKRAADILSENISKFCDSLLFEKGKLSRESEKTKAMKEHIARKLKNTIEELNMNPKAINDDFLYTHILEEKLDNLISISQPSKSSEGTINELKKNLVNKVKEAKDNAKSELAGQIYKQQLRDTISKTLPTSENLSPEEYNSFEVVKDNVADAFINLHFYGGNPEEREKYKNKINKEISNFCNDYLKKHPTTPIEPDKLSKQLYERLNNVSFSSEDSIRDEVEETKIKDFITDYANKLPLNQETPAEALQAYRVISLMSKRLHELEKEKSSLDDYEGTLKNEILKWTKKLPLKYWRDEEVSDFAEKLIDKLKRTEALRKFNPTAMNTLDFDQMKHPVPPTISQEQDRSLRVTDNLTPRIPPSTLSSEDRDHLQRIRERSISERRPRTSPIRKDAAISPSPVDAESQTEIRSWEERSSIPRSPSIQAATQIDEAPHVCQSPICGLRRHRVSLQSETPFCPISPEICNKEYNWSRKGQKERLLPCDLIQPETDPQDLRSSSCECQPRFIPYSFSPGRSSAIPRTCMPPPRPTPNSIRPFQCNLPEDMPAIAKRQKRRDQSPPRREERSRKIVRPRGTALGSWETAQAASKRPERHEQAYGIRNFHDGPLCSTSSRREVLISEDEFEEQDTKEPYKCGCKEAGLSNMYGKERGPSCRDECMRRCPKCCGVHCPYPTRLYFRN